MRAGGAPGRGQGAAERRTRDHRPADPARRAGQDHLRRPVPAFPAAFSITGLPPSGPRWASRERRVRGRRRAGRRARPGRYVPVHPEPADAGDRVQFRGASLLGVRSGGCSLGWALAADRRAGRRAGLAVHVPVPEQHGLDFGAGLHRGGDRRPGQPGRRRRGRPHPRHPAQLRERLPGFGWCPSSAWPR